MAVMKTILELLEEYDPEQYEMIPFFKKEKEGKL
jgi:hypothetical protein